MSGLFIFDCDGVLVDSETIANDECAACLTEAGFAITSAECRARYLGMTMRDLIADMEARAGGALPAGWHAGYKARLAARLEAELQPIPGVAAAIEAIAAAGWQLAVASSSGHAELKLKLARTGLAGYFPGRVFSGQDVAQGKPAPDIYLLAARTLGFDPVQCSAVEDSPNGVRSARAAGLRVFGYCAETPAGELATLGALTFETMDQLPGLVGRPPALAPCVVDGKGQTG